MNLGRKNHRQGDTIRYVVDYSNWLGDGESLKAPCTVTLLVATTGVTISGVLTTPSNEIVFMLAVDSTFVLANQSFTLAVVATNSRNETKNDELVFFVVAP